MYPMKYFFIFCSSTIHLCSSIPGTIYVSRICFTEAHVYTGCAKKKKDILNMYVKSQIINIFFEN